MVPVIDISEHQGATNFATMRNQGVRGVFLRIAHGLTLDTRVGTYYPDALNAGYAANEIGFYSFINPKRGTGADTGRFAAQQCRRVVGGDPKVYMIDVENYTEQTPNKGTHPVRGAAFADYLDEHLAAFSAEAPSTVVIGYGNRSYWNSSLGPNDIALALALDWIVARYPVNSTLGYVAHPLPGTDGWESWAFGICPEGPFPPIGTTWSGWQFSAGYNAQGERYGCTSLNLDLNIVSPAAWARWTGLQPSPSPLPPQEDDMPTVITNSQPRVFDDGQTYPAGAIKWILLDNGSKRHLTVEHAIYGSPAGVAVANAELDRIPNYVPPVTTIPPVVIPPIVVPPAQIPTAFTGDLGAGGKITGKLG